VGTVIIGGIKSIARFVSKVVPFMCIFYVVAGLVIITRNYWHIPAAFSTILYYAFHRPEALPGGLLGTVAQLSQLGGKIMILKIFFPHSVSLFHKTFSNLVR